MSALQDVSLVVTEGSVVGLVGPNGAGKTTLLDVIAGLLKPGSGRVRVLGEPVTPRARAVRRHLGVVHQDTALYEELSGVQNLRFAADLYGVRDPRRRVAEVLDIVGLTDRAEEPVRRLSGGMRRRLAIARALVHDPAVLLLDEPTLGVDVEARHAIWSHVRRLRARGRTILLTTNYLDEAEALCDRVAILRGGTLIADDTTAGLVARVGRCIELDCAGDDVDVLAAVLATQPGVLRHEVTEAGITVYLEGGRSPDALIQRALGAAPLAAFRQRSPDLIEVIRALAQPP